MVNKFLPLVINQILFSNIGGMISAVNQHVVPGRVLGRQGRRHLFIPLLCTHELRVNIIDQAAIVKTLVFNLLADKELSVQIFLSLRSQYGVRSSLFRIFPVGAFGKLETKSTDFGFW